MSNEIGPITLSVATWASTLRYADIPRKVIAYAKLLLLDGIGCTVCGLRRDAGRAMLRFVTSSSSEPAQASIWGHFNRVSPRSAGLVNGTAAHATNVGDTHRATILHTNYVTPQAAIAVGEQRKASGREVLTAVVAGNEAGARAGLAAHLGAEAGYFTAEGRGWHATGTVGPLAAAVAAGRMLRLPPKQMVQAVVLGGTQITGLYRPCGAHMGKHWYAGKAVANGIEAAELARNGFVAGYRYFEDGLCSASGTISPAYDLEAARRDLGSRWETLNIDMAIYPTKKIYYPNIDVVLQIVRAERLTFADIEKIVIRSAFEGAHDFGVFREPRNATQAFNSLRYAVAAAAHDGEFTFRQLAPRKFRNREILTFSRDRIEVRRERELEKMLPDKWPGAADIITRDGRSFGMQVDYHLGQVQRPLDTEQVQKKFRAMAAALGKRRVERVICLIDGFEALDDITTLTRELRPPAYRLKGMH